jgi:hypothetical protein
MKTETSNTEMIRLSELNANLASELNQNDWNVPIEGSLTALRRTLSRLNERVHSSYDFNADPDRMTLEVGDALRCNKIAEPSPASDARKTD